MRPRDPGPTAPTDANPVTRTRRPGADAGTTDEDGDLAVALRDLSPPPAGACPPEERWIELLSGDLAEDEAEALRQHLEACPACVAVAADARRFLAAMGDLVPGREQSRGRRRRLLALAAVASLVLVASALLWRSGLLHPVADPTAELAASLDLPAPPVAAPGSIGAELVYRDGGSGEQLASRTAALAPYRSGDFTAACAALAAHGQRFAADREARFYAGVACLKAGETERADRLLSELAAADGDRQVDARALLHRLRAARRGAGR